jgi:import inner membrane translocase subunit TIM16
MAAGPFARLLAQFVVPLVAVMARAVPAAYAQALQNARKSGVNAAEAAAPVFGKRISRSEALEVLNLTEAEASSPEAIQKVGPECVLLCFTQLFEVFSTCILSASIFPSAI